VDNNKLRALAKKLHAVMGSDNHSERETARAKLVELLAKHKLTWNDLPDLLDTDAAGPAIGDDGGDQPAAPALNLIFDMLAQHLHLTDHELTALTSISNSA
jgi:hypothetical protein